MGYQALLFCPDEKTARTVTHVLNDLDFAVEPCTEPFAAVKRLMAQHFDAVVVDCDNEQNATLLFKSARNSTANQNSLAVAVVEGQAGVAKAFRIGANLVLTKPINVEQAKGTLRVARGLLRKGAEASKGGASAAAPAAPPAAPTPAASAARPLGPVAPSRPTTTAAPSFSPKPTMSAHPVQPAAPSAPPMVGSAPTFEMDERDFDSILEADDAEVLETLSAPAPLPASPAPAEPVATPAASATPRNFPWQPAKPMAEPMGSALRRAADVAGKIDSTSSAGRFASLVEEKRPGSSSIGLHMGQGAAAASAPAPEKVPPAITAVVEPAIPSTLSAPSFSEPEPPKVVEKPPASSSHDDATRPTFFPGGYDPEEVEGGGKTKAIVIIAAVVLLASSAAYLSWRNTRSKSVAPAASAPAASAPAPDSTPPQPNGTTSQETSTAAPEVSEITLGNASAAAATKPAASKPAVKETAPDADTDSEPEVTQRLIVKNDMGRVAKPAPAPDEPVQAPTDVDMGAGPDAKSLANLSNTTAHIPKAAPQVLRVSQGVMEGLVIKRVQPKYPAQAMQLRIQGTVQLEATISKDGSIKNLKVVSGDGLLARAAQEAVKQWQYKPYYLNGDPVEIQTEIVVNFKLPN